MRVVCISDTHGRHRKLSVPDGDLLIHAGDITTKGELWQVASFNKWLGELPHKHKVVICGNHDFCFQKEAEKAQSTLTNAIYLQDQAVDIEGFVIYGSPWQPWYHDWAFNLPRNSPELAEKWANIPEETDILITHGPPWEIGDWVKRTSNLTDPIPGVPRVGCMQLAERVTTLKNLKLHVFGHIHESYGVFQKENTVFVNASSVDLSYKPINQPIILDL